MLRAIAKWIVIVSIAFGWNVSARTQGVDGQAEYLSYCAACHGADGKGKDPSSVKLKKQ